MTEKLTYTEATVDEADADIRLDRWFKRHVPQVNHTLLEKSLRKGFVKVDGRKATASQRIAAGQIIRFPNWENTSHIPRPITRPQLDAKQIAEFQKLVIYKDANILAINKPSGLAVQDGTKITKSVDSLLDHLKFDAKERPKLVHRIDKDTSGILLLGRNTKAASLLTQAFAKKKVKKIYWALTIGVPDLHEGKIDLPLAKQAGDFEKMDVDEKDGKHAVTLYRVVEHLAKKLAWLELYPVTGRTHQLRVHLAAIGHPIQGDGKYGGHEAYIEGLEISQKLHLHARHVVLPPLFGGKAIEIKASLPPHMKESWKELGFDSEDRGRSILDSGII